MMRARRQFLQQACGLSFGLTLGGCAHTWSVRSQPTLPLRHEMVRGQLVIRSDEPLPPDHRLLGEIVAQRAELLGLLNLPTSNEPIHVYLFSSHERFREFMQARFPHLPDRRAFFVEKDTALEIYAHWGDRVAEDLRHEVTHGYLHSVVPRIPLWIDEGLAEYFEVPRGQHGLNRPHVALLTQRTAAGWQPHLRRLEVLSAPDDMDQGDYAESWAWVHLLLHSRNEQRELLRNFLSDVRTTAAPPPLSARLARQWANPDQVLAAYVPQLAGLVGTTGATA